jgi:hypothetical protein
MGSTLGYTTVVELENLLLVDVDPSFESQVDSWKEAQERP